ncbi:MAG: 6-phosphofructokinase, partial [Chloroflexi bacterium]|nr:6-phosphofructokinase [Chloroflexota bacterium]
AYDRGKNHALAVIAEGATYNVLKLMAYFEEHRESTGFAVRATILGHVQRGAAPTAADRLLATRLGEGAIRALARGEKGVLTGLRGNQVVTTPLDEVVNTVKPLDAELAELARIMAI